MCLVKLKHRIFHIHFMFKDFIQRLGIAIDGQVRSFTDGRSIARRNYIAVSV